jgi:hypothetical protein
MYLDKEFRMPRGTSMNAGEDWRKISIAGLRRIPIDARCSRDGKVLRCERCDNRIAAHLVFPSAFDESRKGLCADAALSAVSVSSRLKLSRIKTNYLCGSEA